MLENGNFDERSLHSGDKVITGRKQIATIWFVNCEVLIFVCVASLEREGRIWFDSCFLLSSLANDITVGRRTKVDDMRRRISID